MAERSGSEEGQRWVRRRSTGFGAAGGGNDEFAGCAGGESEAIRSEISASVKGVPVSADWGASGAVPARVAIRSPDARLRTPDLAIDGSCGRQNSILVNRTSSELTENIQVRADLLALFDLLLNLLGEVAASVRGVDLNGQLVVSVDEFSDLLVAISGFETGEQVLRDDERERVLLLELRQLGRVRLERNDRARHEHFQRCSHYVRCGEQSVSREL